MNEMLKIGQAAKRCRVCVRTMRSWADNGRVPSFRTPTGHRLFPGDIVARAYGAQPTPLALCPGPAPVAAGAGNSKSKGY